MPLPVNSFHLAEAAQKAKAKDVVKPKKPTMINSFASEGTAAAGPSTPTRGLSALPQPLSTASKRKREISVGDLKALPSPQSFRLSTPSGVKTESPDTARTRERSETPLRAISSLVFGLEKQSPTVKPERPLAIPNLKFEVKQEEQVLSRPMINVTSLPAPRVRETAEDVVPFERTEAEEWVTPSKKGVPGRRTGKPPLSYLLARALTPQIASLTLFYQSLSSILRNVPANRHIRSATLHLRLSACDPTSTLFRATSFDGLHEYHLLLQPLPKGCVLCGADPAVVRARGEAGYEVGIWGDWGELEDVLVCSRYLIVAP